MFAKILALPPIEDDPTPASMAAELASLDADEAESALDQQRAIARNPQTEDSDRVFASHMALMLTELRDGASVDQVERWIYHFSLCVPE